MCSRLPPRRHQGLGPGRPGPGGGGPGGRRSDAMPGGRGPFLPSPNISAANGGGSPVPTAGAASGVCTPPGSPSPSGAVGVTICSTTASSRGAMTTSATSMRLCGWSRSGGDWNAVRRTCRDRGWPPRSSGRNRCRRDPAREVVPRVDSCHRQSACPEPLPRSWTASCCRLTLTLPGNALG